MVSYNMAMASHGHVAPLATTPIHLHSTIQCVNVLHVSEISKCFLTKKYPGNCFQQPFNGLQVLMGSVPWSLEGTTKNNQF